MASNLQRTTVFISYAREDRRIAERLYMDLRRAEVDAWLDVKCILPGQSWAQEVRRIIRQSAYFIALLSHRSLSKRGHVQTEFKTALSVLEEMPSNQIFVIPVRLDDCEPQDEPFRNLSWVDLFPSYDKGLGRILSVCSDLTKHPLVTLDAAIPAGRRAPIEFTPFRSFQEFARDFFARLPDASMFADRDFSVYITLRTTHSKVVLPEHVRSQYPEAITIVLQNQYQHLAAGDEAITVQVWFSAIETKIVVPYDAITEITLPLLRIRVQHLPEEPVA